MLLKFTVSCTISRFICWWGNQPLVKSAGNFTLHSPWWIGLLAFCVNDYHQIVKPPTMRAFLVRYYVLWGFTILRFFPLSYWATPQAFNTRNPWLILGRNLASCANFSRFSFYCQFVFGFSYFALRYAFSASNISSFLTFYELFCSGHSFPLKMALDEVNFD